MDLSIQIGIFKNIHVVLLKVEDTFFTSLTQLMLETKPSICSTMEENILKVLCRKFLAFDIVVIV